jgi:hypothetical protein
MSHTRVHLDLPGVVGLISRFLAMDDVEGADGRDVETRNRGVSTVHQEKPLLRIVHILLPFVDNFGMAPIAGKC